MPGERRQTVLIVDDDPQVRALYAEYLADDYTVRTASDGRDALERVDESTDVVLLDRRMPGLSGAEVIEQIRERTTGCAVAIVTGVEPDLDIIDMGFDDYVVKPVTAAKLTAMVERLCRWLEYESCIREYYVLARKAALLRSEVDEPEQRRAPEYRALIRRLEAVEADAQQALDRALTVDDVETVFQRTVSSD